MSEEVDQVLNSQSENGSGLCALKDSDVVIAKTSQTTDQNLMDEEPEEESDEQMLTEDEDISEKEETIDKSGEQSVKDSKDNDQKSCPEASKTRSKLLITLGRVNRSSWAIKRAEKDSTDVQTKKKREDNSLKNKTSELSAKRVVTFKEVPNDSEQSFSDNYVEEVIDSLPFHCHSCEQRFATIGEAFLHMLKHRD